MKSADLLALKTVDEWAARRIGANNEPPWDWYQLMKLREAIEALLASDAASSAIPTSELPTQRAPFKVVE